MQSPLYLYIRHLTSYILHRKRPVAHTTGGCYCCQCRCECCYNHLCQYVENSFLVHIIYSLQFTVYGLQFREMRASPTDSALIH